VTRKRRDAAGEPIRRQGGVCVNETNALPACCGNPSGARKTASDIFWQPQEAQARLANGKCRDNVASRIG
jgi:hypothetical protein